MPLTVGTSRKTFEKNFEETKVNAKTGKERSVAQRLAIAYSAQRKAKKRGE